MRPMGTIVGVLRWRVSMTRTGYALQLRRLLSVLIMLGGVGIALGYGIISRFAQPGDEDEAGPRPVAE